MPEKKEKAPEKKPEKKEAGLLEKAGVDVKQAKKDLQAFSVKGKPLKNNDVERWGNKHLGGRFVRRLVEVLAEEWS